MTSRAAKKLGKQNQLCIKVTTLPDQRLVASGLSNEVSLLEYNRNYQLTSKLALKKLVFLINMCFVSFFNNGVISLAFKHVLCFIF